MFNFLIPERSTSVGNSYKTKDPTAMVPELMDSYFRLVGELYEWGARQFLFLNVPPTTRSPMIAAQNNTVAHAKYVDMYNRELSARIGRFRQTYSEVSTCALHRRQNFLAEETLN